MKKIILALFLSVLLCSSAFAIRDSWETGMLPYKPSMSGSVCWTAVRRYKEDRRYEPVFHSMDLSTGKIRTQLLEDWYLIQTDYDGHGTLIARQQDGMLQIAEYTKGGKWKPFLEYPFENTYSYFNTATQREYKRAVVAYMGGCLYYMMSDGNRDWLRKDDMHGNIYDYATGYDLTRISPGGNILGTDSDGNKVVETANGEIFPAHITETNRLVFYPICWRDDQHLLVWVKELNPPKTIQLYEYVYAEDSLVPILNENDEPIPLASGCDGYTCSYDPATHRSVQLIFWAEDFFCVPTVMDLDTGIPTFIAETEHTDQFDEYCSTHDRVVWLIPG